MHAAAGATHCSLGGEAAVMTGGRERAEGRNRTEEDLFLFGDYSKKSANRLLGLPNSRIPLPGHGHTQSPMC